MFAEAHVVHAMMLLLLPVALASPSHVVGVAVDARGSGEVLVHKWKRSFGSGHAGLTLREDWRAHASQAVSAALTHILPLSPHPHEPILIHHVWYHNALVKSCMPRKVVK